MSSKPLSFCVAVSCTVASASATTVAGLARAKDGDFLIVGETEIRLFGIDAPEFDQTSERRATTWACGTEAADRLASLLTGKQVRCISIGTDRHDRALGRCTVGTTDIKREMVATGFAVAYRHYSSDYVSAEQAAKANRRGIWAGTFEMPRDYRHDGAPISRATNTRRSREPLPKRFTYSH